MTQPLPSARWLVISGGVILASVLAVCLLTLVNTDTGEAAAPRTRHSDTASPHSSSSSSSASVFISVKTSAKFHSSRLAVVLGTWFQLARRSTWLFTDAEDEALRRAAGGHLVVTSCPADHSRQALSCKMQAEFDMFLDTDKRWDTVQSRA